MKVRRDIASMGRLRALWNGHLGIDDELRVLAPTLGVSMRLGSAEELRERLNDKFAAVGMRRIPADEAGFGYDDIIAKLHAQGRTDFDRESFRSMVHNEKLLGGKEPPATIIGVRSFMHPVDSLEGRATINLNFVPSFDGRFLKDETDWNGDIYPALKAFVIGEAQKGDRIQLAGCRGIRPPCSRRPHRAGQSGSRLPSSVISMTGGLRASLSTFTPVTATAACLSLWCHSAA